MGFEPTRAEHNGLAVHRLNHSATSSAELRLPLSSLGSELVLPPAGPAHVAEGARPGNPARPTRPAGRPPPESPSRPRAPSSPPRAPGDPPPVRAHRAPTSGLPDGAAPDAAPGALPFRPLRGAAPTGRRRSSVGDAPGREINKNDASPREKELTPT
ncbi:hypothetical protein VULLAG_LOCUS21340 [Vulpes lagopus]